MSITDYDVLDFSKVIQSRINKDTSFLRIPINGKSIKNEFVLLQTNDDGRINRGRKIFLSKAALQSGSKSKSFNGTIIVENLKGELLVNSEIVNGFILDFHIRSSVYSPNSMADPYITLPEVVVVGYRSSGGGLSFGDLMSLQSLFGGNFGGWSNYYSFIDAQTGDGGGSGGGSGGGGSAGDGTSQDPPVLIDFEPQFDNPNIDIEKYLKCFDTVPDDGAASSITLYTDIPVDDNYTKFFNWEIGAPGHVFITITKQNGSQRISQNFGFYPVDRKKVGLTYAPEDGKLVDNEGHEFNASIKMNLSVSDLQITLNKIRSLISTVRYDLDDYNCTDFALDVFNVTRADKIQIAMDFIPNGNTNMGTSTPNSLYYRLHEMKAAGHSEANNITANIFKGWAGGSTGPCE
jgi:hypothetical protein